MRTIIIERFSKMATFKERFLVLQQRKGKTLSEIAESLGINQSTLSRILSGKYQLKYEMLESLSKYFNVDKAYLLGESDIPNQDESNYQMIPSDLKYFKKEFKQSTINLVREIEELYLTPDEARIVLKTYVESMKKLQQMRDKKDSE